MSELPSALFSIADGSEFRFARFYIVCEEVPLGTPESPPIVSGVSDMHPSACPNVEETRNPMQTFDRKKCSHFSPTNFPLHFHMKSVGVFLIIFNITYHKKDTTHFIRTPSAALHLPSLRTATGTQAAPPQCSKQHWRTHTRSPVHSFRSGTADWSRVQR